MASHRELLKLAIPNILTNLSVPLAGLVDMALLGHLDHVAPLAGVAIATLIFDYLYWSFGFLRMGTVGLAAQAYGEENRQAQADILWRALLIAMVLGFVMILFRQPIGELAFTLLDGSETVEASGAEYYLARIWGAVPALSLFVLNGWLLGLHHPRMVLLIALILNGTNIVLSYLFIYQYGWGAAGAGYATMIAEWLAMTVGLILMVVSWRGIPPLSWPHLLDKQALLRMVALNRDIMIRTFCLISAFALFINFSAAISTTLLAANALLERFLLTAAYFIDGFAFALESLAGKYAGKRDGNALKRSLSVALKWNIGTVLLFIALLLSAGDIVLGLLTQHEAIITQALDFRIHFSIALLFAGFAYIFDGYFIGLTDGRVLRNSTLITFFIGFLPLALWARETESPEILWFALIGLMAMRSITLIYAYHRRHSPISH